MSGSAANDPLTGADHSHNDPAHTLGGPSAAALPRDRCPLFPARHSLGEPDRLAGVVPGHGWVRCEQSRPLPGVLWASYWPSPRSSVSSSIPLVWLLSTSPLVWLLSPLRSGSAPPPVPLVLVGFSYWSGYWLCDRCRGDGDRSTQHWAGLDQARAWSLFRETRCERLSSADGRAGGHGSPAGGRCPREWPRPPAPRLASAGS